MPNWDIFHSDRLEVERNLSLASIQSAVARGEIVDEDLARTAGSGEAWVRLSEQGSLWAMFSGASDLPDEDEEFEDDEDEDGETAAQDSNSLRDMFGEDDDGQDNDEPPPKPTLPAPRRGSDFTAVPLPSGVRKGTTEDLDPVGFPDSYDRDIDLNLSDPRNVVTLDRDDDDYGDDYDPEAEDDEAAGFTFSRAGAETVEELDLAAMVDVAFQLVLFFLVTASTIVFKTLEVPPPKPDESKKTAGQVIGKTMAEAQQDHILVEVDANGEVKIDHEKAPNDFAGLSSRLRDVRKATDRNSILLTAESTTAHKNAVKVLDAAAEVGLGLAIAKPIGAPEKAPVPPPAPPK